MLQTSTEFGGVMSADVRVIQARFLLLGEPMEGNIKQITVNLGTGCENGFQPGTLYSSYITARIEDCTERLENQTITLQIGAVLPDETVEWVTVGVYTVGAPDTDAYGTEFTAYGSLSTKFGGTYNADAAESIATTVAKLGAQTGCTIDTSAYSSEVLNLVPAQAFQGLQQREVLMYIASLLGGFATETADGNIRIGTYQTQATMSIDADRTTELFTCNDLDHIITGVSVIVSEDTEDEDGNTVAGTVYSYETPNLMLTNPYMTQALFNRMAKAVTGLRFRPATLPITMGDIRLEAGDMLSVTDVSGSVYTVPCLGVVHTYEGGLETTVAAVGSSETEQNANFSGSLSARVERNEVGLLLVHTAVMQKASIKELAAVRAQIESLDVDTLHTVDATIKLLKSDVANIQTIMSGQIGTGELQALHLTSGNVVIDNAVITDAMIADVSADKLQSGTIYTNLIHIMSGSGNLSLTDNTILFQDDSGVPRIQIGKDAQGDYNYYLWDADGNPMWNASGATEFGLNDGIIRDVAVAADANISGDKLNIQSVADALNEDGSLRVDSSQIIMDGTTLSAAFSSVSAKADEASDAVNGLSFGSRNYIRNSQTMVWPDYSLMSHDSGAVVGNALVGTAVVGASSDPASYFETVQTAAPNGETETVLKLNRADGDTYRFRMNALIPGKYTFAVWLRSDSEVQVTIDQFGTVTEHTVGTEWTHIVVHAVAESGKMDILITLSGGSTLYLYKGMLQTGSWDTDWKPAPEDTQEQIEAVATNVTTLRTEFSVVQGKVEAKIWQSDIDTAMGTIEEQYSQVTQTLDGITSRVGTLTTVTDGMSTRLTNAESSITQNAKQIALRVTANDVTSLIEQNADAIRLKASKISWKSDNSSMTESGKLYATGAEISGEIIAREEWLIGKKKHVREAKLDAGGIDFYCDSVKYLMIRADSGDITVGESVTYKNWSEVNVIKNPLFFTYSTDNIPSIKIDPLDGRVCFYKSIWRMNRTSAKAEQLSSVLGVHSTGLIYEIQNGFTGNVTIEYVSDIFDGGHAYSSKTFKIANGIIISVS